MCRATLFCRKALLSLTFLAGIAGSLHGQVPKSSFQAHLISLLAQDVLVGAGAGVGFRPGGRMGLVGSASLVRRRNIGARFEGLVTYQLEQIRPRGSSVYVLGGFAVETAPNAQFLVLGVGVEQSPGSSTGWFGEIGLGGGVRLKAGYRVRPGPD
jgi:hypothetical protein